MPENFNNANKQKAKVSMGILKLVEAKPSKTVKTAPKVVKTKKITAPTKKRVHIPVHEFHKFKSIYAYLRYVVEKHLIPAIQAGIEDKGTNLQPNKVARDFKREFSKWLMSQHSFGKPVQLKEIPQQEYEELRTQLENANKPVPDRIRWTGKGTIDKNSTEFAEYLESFLRFIKKKVPASSYIGVKESIRQLSNFAVTQYGHALHEASKRLREDVENGGDGFGIIEEVATEFGVNSVELTYFWKKVVNKVDTAAQKETDAPSSTVVVENDANTKLVEKLKEGINELKKSLESRAREWKDIYQPIEDSLLLEKDPQVKQQNTLKVNTFKSEMANDKAKLSVLEGRLNSLPRIIEIKKNLDDASRKIINDTEKRLREKFYDELFMIEPEDYSLYLKNEDELAKDEAERKLEEEKEKARPQSPYEEGTDEEETPPENSPLPKFRNWWDSMVRLLPRGFAEKVKDYNVIWDYSFREIPRVVDRTTGEKEVVQVEKKNEKYKQLTFMKRGQGFRILPDVNEKEIVIPFQCHAWQKERILSGMVDAAVRVFFHEAGILRRGSIPKFLSGIFVSTKDIDLLVEVLNAMTDDVVTDSAGAKYKLFKNDKPIVESLEEELKSTTTDAERVTKWHAWWAEHGGHFTALFKNKHMIPLFHKWAVDVVKARVLRKPIPDSVPFPVINFINKLSSFDELQNFALSRIAEIRFELAKNAPDEKEFDQKLIETSLMIKRRAKAARRRYGIPKRLLPA